MEESILYGTSCLNFDCCTDVSVPQAFHGCLCECTRWYSAGDRSLLRPVSSDSWNGIPRTRNRIEASGWEIVYL